jgi:hypothetical protein
MELPKVNAGFTNNMVFNHAVLAYQQKCVSLIKHWEMVHFI